MKLRIPKKIKILLTNLYLDIAEKYQGSNLRAFKELQQWRKHQLKRAKKSYEKSRPPEGNALEFLSFRLFELYNIEELDLLEKDLKKLITNYKDEENFDEHLNKIRNGSTGYSFYTVGVILNNPKTPPLPFFNYRLMRLPQEISYISIGLYQILPSFLIVTFDVKLNKIATKKLIEIQSFNYYPQLIFENIIPWKFWRGGIKNIPANQIREKKVINWINKLESQVEKCLDSFIKGFFLKNNKKRNLSLPVVEIFKMKGIPKDTDKLPDWIRKANGWLDSFSFNFNYSLYDQGDILFTPLRTGLWNTSKSYRFIIREEHAKEHLGDDNRLNFGTLELLNCLNPYITIVEFLENIKMDMHDLKSNIFKIFKNKFNFRKTLGKSIKENTLLNTKIIFLKRLQIEFEEYESLIKMDLSALESFNKMKFSSREKANNLKNFIINHLKYKMEFLKRNIEYIEDSFSKYLTLKNIEASIKIQNANLILSIILIWLTIMLVWLTATLANNTVP